jgi:hypothetical protein
MSTSEKQKKEKKRAIAYSKTNMLGFTAGVLRPFPIRKRLQMVYS